MVAKASPRLEIHLEWPWHAVTYPSTWATYSTYQSLQSVSRLLELLKINGVSATFYTLGHIAMREPRLIERIQHYGHLIGSHGYWHRHGEREGDQSDQLARKYLPECVGYRSPYWDSTPRPGMAGGVFFRTLPYSLLKAEIYLRNVLYLHPHDLFSSSIGPLRRRVFLCDPWKRLERLLNEIPFASACS